MYVHWDIIQPQGKEILPLVITQMDLESTMLSKESQRKQILDDIIIWGIFKSLIDKNKVEWLLPEAGV